MESLQVWYTSFCLTELYFKKYIILLYYIKYYITSYHILITVFPPLSTPSPFPASFPPHPLLLFLVRTGQVSHGYQPVLAYQVAVRLGKAIYKVRYKPNSSYPILDKATQQGKGVPKVSNRVRDSPDPTVRNPHKRINLYN